ncbi:MAG TPA: hypothetical protein VN043_02495 [Rhodanobacter sp.]|nr:hypothetical protein [Rhodanobacter sp.]
MKCMTIKLALLAGLGLGSAALLYTPPVLAAGQVSIGVGVGIGVAPPAPRYERAPPPRHGYVWAPGYWRWSGRAHRHVWVGGHWEHNHPGHHYHPAHWVQRGHHWRFQDGYWGR